MAPFGTIAGLPERPQIPGSKIAITILVIVIVFLFAGVGCSPVTTIPAGHVGVTTLFGSVTGDILPAGIHLINPLKAVQKMSIRTMEIKEAASVPSSEGLILNLECSLIYHLDESQAANVFKNLGMGYEASIVEPTVRSAIREATASHSANTLYSGEREAVAAEIEKSLIRQLAPRGIVVEKLLMRDIKLPETLKNAIEAKQQAEQESLAMSFRLQKERQEAERKRIEAQGIKDFQTIVSQGISEPLLKWKGIEATEKLSYSPNAKIIVIGSGKTGLPLILGQE
jgi:regulator of protease activity HflC (stomatin/prohibitin superfamily)